jgi:hypothetical protein
MPPEIVALIDKPWLLLIVLAVGAVCGMVAERVGEQINRAERRRYWQRKNGGRQSTNEAAQVKERKASPVEIAADQLRLVMEARFVARPLLNKSERRLLGVIDQALAEYSPGWRAMGQVSLGEVLSSPNQDAYFAVNSKRVDMLIVDADCRPLHAVEFQGRGHHTGRNTAARDAVKREALRRAGIGYVEVVSGDTPAEVREMVRKLVGRVEGA